MASRWYGPPHVCKTCGQDIIPVRRNGFWRVPAHTTTITFRGKPKEKPCAAEGDQIVARYGDGT